MKRTFTRGMLITRMLRIIICLGSRGYTYNELSRKLAVPRKTIYRDIRALQTIAPVLVTHEYREEYNRVAVYRLEKDWARQFFKQAGGDTANKR